jgi:DNA-binding XRE family transcriptional regulator
MNIHTHINYQTIYEGGKPAFAVLAYKDFLKICPEAKYDKDIPHAVVQRMIKKNQSRIRAWREYLGLTQEELASAMNISQAALSQMEAPGVRLRRVTLKKLAESMGLTINQLK